MKWNPFRKQETSPRNRPPKIAIENYSNPEFWLDNKASHKPFVVRMGPADVDLVQLEKQVQASESLADFKELLETLFMQEDGAKYPFYDDSDEDAYHIYPRIIRPTEILSAMQNYLDSKRTDPSYLRDVPLMGGLREHFLKLYPPEKKSL